MNLVAWRCRASTLLLLLVQDVKHRLLILKSTRHGPKSITSRWRSSPSLSDGSGVTNAAAVHAASHGHAGSECFSSSSSSTSSSTFLLHAASQPGSSPARRLGRAAGRSRRARPRLFQQSQRPTERRRWQQQQRASSAQSDIRASPRLCRTQRGIQDRDAAALVRHLQKKSGKLEIILDSMAWKRAIRANAQRHTHPHHTNTASASHTHLGRHNGERISPRIASPPSPSPSPSPLCCDLKMRLSPLLERKQQKKKK